MPQLLIRHRVQDYAKWKPIFDEHGVTRAANGSRGYRLFRNSSDPNELVILFDWESVAKAQQFAQTADLRETMQRAGVVDQPTIFFLEEIESGAT